MPASSVEQPAHDRPNRDIVTSLGGWLFTHRTAVPLPLAIALLAIKPQPVPVFPWLWSGAVLVVCGELIRLWAVRHIGVISRTRSARLGPLVCSGPFAHVRNPLYLGNVALWTGFAVSARLPGVAMLVILVLGFEYHAIVRWEEQLLDARIGDAYRRYVASVPRWLPRPGDSTRAAVTAAHSWRETLFSERGTLIAIAGGYVALWLKALL
jgi:protein-S-isoprenylcysteine O-methyltransferase Ste14